MKREYQICITVNDYNKPVNMTIDSYKVDIPQKRRGHRIAKIATAPIVYAVVVPILVLGALAG